MDGNIPPPQEPYGPSFLGLEEGTEVFDVEQLVADAERPNHVWVLESWPWWNASGLRAPSVCSWMGGVAHGRW